MGRTLAETINERKAIMSFMDNLSGYIATARFEKSTAETHSMLENVKWTNMNKITQGENETEDDFLKRKEADHNEHSKIRKGFSDYLKTNIMRTRNEYMLHLTALHAYGVMYDRYKDMVSDNSGHVNDKVLYESQKNIEIMRAKMNKLGIEMFEIYSVENHDRNYEDKLKEAFFSNFNQDMEEYESNPGYFPKLKTEEEKENYRKAFMGYINEEKMHAINPVTENDKEFYATLANSGYRQFRGLNELNLRPDTHFQAAPGGYEFNEDGKMVEKPANGIFAKIARFFQRLSHKSEAEAYNQKIDEAKISCDDKEALAEAEALKHSEAQKEQLAVDLQKNQVMTKTEALVAAERVQENRKLIEAMGNQVEDKALKEAEMVQNDEDVVQFSQDEPQKDDPEAVNWNALD